MGRQPASGPGAVRRALLGLLALVGAAAIWLPCLRFLYPTDPEAVLDHATLTPQARALARRHLQLWEDPALQAREIEPMRRTNPEMVFMGRSFLVWALANLARRDPGMQEQALATIDAIIDATLTEEARHGQTRFLMAYASATPWVQQPPRSLFVDSEIALMLGVRRLVEERSDYRNPMAQRVRLMHERMSQAPALSAESYPDECWIFDCANALAAMRLSDVLDGTDHRAFMATWVERARERLLDPTTGLLVSAITFDGDIVKDGPEGSTIWQTVHALQLVDRGFAREQYDLARRHLARTILGFAVSREWPPAVRGPQDVDSGLVIPLLDASPSASGLALVAASSFGDPAFLGPLLRSLELAGLPVREGPTLRYAASNQVGDAVILYALCAGPLWAEVWQRSLR